MASPAQIKKAKQLIYEVFDILDKSGLNTEQYKEKFSKMSDKEFIKFVSLEFPYRFYDKPFVTNVSMEDINKACNKLGVPLLEKVQLPYLYQNKDGESVNTLECLVGYYHHKKVQQFVTHKNSMSSDIDDRDMKTGLLTGFDKNGKSSDREIESLAFLGLEDTMTEFTRPRADAMKSKNMMYNQINTTGQVSLNDIPIDIDDSLAKNLLNTYLIGALLNSNLINQDYYLPYTIKGKKKELLRK